MKASWKIVVPFAFLDMSKFTTNYLINSTVVFYSRIVNTYRVEKHKSERKLQPSKHLKQDAPLFRRLGKQNRTLIGNCTCTCAPSNHNNRYCVHAMFSPASMLPCFSCSICTWAPILLPNMVRDRQTDKQKTRVYK